MSDRRPRGSRAGRAGAMLPAWPCALVVIAHPDDESFGLGAVIDRLAAAGAAVHIICYTHDLLHPRRGINLEPDARQSAPRARK